MFSSSFSFILLVVLSSVVYSTPSNNDLRREMMRSYGNDNRRNNYGNNNYGNNYSFHQGRCRYTNGVIYDNGVSRQPTEQEQQQISQYKQQMEQYWKQFGQAFSVPMNDWNNKLGSLQKPQDLCLCSQETCGQHMGGIPQAIETIKDILN